MKGLTWTKLPARVMGATRRDIGLFLHRCAGLRQACVCMLGEEGRGGVGTWQRSPELFAVVKPRLGRGIRPSQAFATPKTAPDLAMKPSLTLMKTL